MGSDKALLSLPLSNIGVINHATTTFAEYLTELLIHSCDDVVIVARDEVQATTISTLPYIASISPTEVRVIHDRIPDIGPLMGLYTGLSAIHHPHALVTAVDMPLIQPALLTFLLSLPRDEALLIPRVHDAPQVLLAIYPRVILPDVKERLEMGRRDPRSLLDVVPVRFIEEEQLRMVDPELRSFVNVNTPEDYIFVGA